MMPVRIHWSRVKGARNAVPGAVNITRSGPWGNPYNEVEKNPRKFGPGHYNKATAKFLFYRDLLLGLLSFTVADVKRELRGNDVMCFCKPWEDCHGDILLLIANT
jgi:hypothetical protein